MDKILFHGDFKGQDFAETIHDLSREKGDIVMRNDNLNLTLFRMDKTEILGMGSYRLNL
jgi:hypothetical protein